MKTNSGFTFDYNNQIIDVVVNGVVKKMTMTQYKAYKRKLKKDKEIKDRNARIIPLLAPYITKTIKQMKLIKSLTAYYHNGYRQWGTIVNEILDNEFVSAPFTLFVGKANDIEKKIKQIEKIAKKNDKDIFGYIEKLHFQLDDLKNILADLENGVSASGILRNPYYKGKEVIFGNGRRLGLKVLMSRAFDTSIQMQQAIEEFEKLCKDGVDAMEYNGNGQRNF